MHLTVAQCRTLRQNVSLLSQHELRSTLTAAVAYSQGRIRASWEASDTPKWWRKGEHICAYDIDAKVEQFRQLNTVAVDGQRAALFMFYTSRIPSQTSKVIQRGDNVAKHAGDFSHPNDVSEKLHTSSQRVAASPATEKQKPQGSVRYHTDIEPVSEDGTINFDVDICRKLRESLDYYPADKLRGLLRAAICYSQETPRASWKNAPNWWCEGEAKMESFRPVKRMNIPGVKSALIMFFTSRLYFESEIKQRLSASELDEVANGKNPYPPKKYTTDFSEVDGLNKSLENVKNLSTSKLQETLLSVVRYSQRKKRPSWDPKNAPNWWGEGEVVDIPHIKARVEPFAPVRRLSTSGMKAALVMFYSSRIYFENHQKDRLTTSELEQIGNGKNPYPPIITLKQGLQNVTLLASKVLRQELSIAVASSQGARAASWKPTKRPNWWCEGESVNAHNFNAKICAFGPKKTFSKTDIEAALIMFYLSLIYFEKHLKGRLSASELKEIADGKNPYPPSHYGCMNSEIIEVENALSSHEDDGVGDEVASEEESTDDKNVEVGSIGQERMDDSEEMDIEKDREQPTRKHRTMYEKGECTTANAKMMPVTHESEELARARTELALERAKLAKERTAFEKRRVQVKTEIELLARERAALRESFRKQGASMRAECTQETARLLLESAKELLCSVKPISTVAGPYRLSLGFTPRSDTTAVCDTSDAELPTASSQRQASAAQKRKKLDSPVRRRVRMREDCSRPAETGEGTSTKRAM